jgi:hypothetical protein
MRYGHSPGDIDNYPWRDVRLFMDHIPMLDPTLNLGGDAQ